MGLEATCEHPRMDLGLEGKVCVVTGASRGIGLETCRGLTQAGARVLMVARREEARAPAARMAQRGGGRIVNVCSSAGKRPSLTNPAYSVTKAAQLSLSRVFADQYGPQGVLVNAVAPGPVASPLWTAPGGMADQLAQARGITREEALAAEGGKTLLGRFGEPEEIAAVIVFLCSARAGNVLGAAWSVDGGNVGSIV